ncbi:hypothetical protein BDC45DRAFT_568992 [Circinella umbellata]|nr:hypothetical protein BDC45DRAFT_568992 [Circinella umbellata]
MSSLTSLSVNKNNRSFAPKVKARPRKTAQQTQQTPSQDQPEAEKESTGDTQPNAQTENDSTKQNVQTTESSQPHPLSNRTESITNNLTPPETLGTVASSATQEVEVQRAVPSSSSSPAPTVTESTVQESTSETDSAAATSSSAKEPATSNKETTAPNVPPKDKGKQKQRSTKKKSTSKNNNKATPISTPISISVPGQDSSADYNRESTAVSSSHVEDEAADESTNRRGGRGRKRKEYDPEGLKTLDDIQHDPAPKDYLDRPMADFIRDLQTGVVSKNFKEYEIDRVAKKKKLEEQNKMSNTEKEAAQAQERLQEQIKQLQEEAQRREAKERRQQQQQGGDDSVLQETSNAPQVRLVNGQIVLDVDSLTVERQNEYEEIDTSAMEIVEESSLSRKVNSRTHGKYIQSARWTPAETENFYDAISMFGTDFEMIKHVLPNRTRNQIRSKFNREEKSHPEKIKEYLIYKKKPIDLEKMKELSGKEFEEVPDAISEPIFGYTD